MASAESDDAAATPELMCSVLNVVIDHSMDDPTPLEPEDYKKQKLDGKTKVPVIRIFGPLLRDAAIGPLQSACLYVHGAFPYLLARPTLAGPDGSLRRASSVSGQVNWDDPVSVGRIVDSIQTILEDAIQSLDAERRQQQEHEMQKPKDTVSVIRRITVVQGRGFYTYCPGPVAPFLRVEYYDPKLRWKVKMVLERGFQVPLSFFPDPIQYDREDEDDAEVLRFHCYEAHIPYTMQFFKDWNLAGMAYLQVQRGLIRPTLRETCLAKYRAKPFDKELDSSAVFLRSNTPSKYLWPAPSRESMSEKQDGYRNDVLHDPRFSPPSKGTIADVEIDCTVRDLRNVDAVLKTLPSDIIERDKIQWRAVPSLHEIWRQERQRMAKLLAPEQDFLSPRQSPPLDEHTALPPKIPFTLNVKQGAERSGAKLAVKGMKSLVKVTYGLEESFERSLRQILTRHKNAIEQADQNLLQAQDPSPPFSTPVVARPRAERPNLTPNMDEAIEALASLSRAAVTTPKTPSFGDAIDALACLENVPAVGYNTPRNLDTPKSLRSHLGRDMDMEDAVHAFSLPASQESQPPAGLSYPSSQEMQHDSDPLTIIDPVVLSQRIDRGDSIFQDASAGLEILEEYIDAETLLPFESLDFGEDRCRVRFTTVSDPQGTIRICGNLYSHCRREGHNHCNHQDRAHPGYYKTVTTGTFVDGILDTSHEEHDDEQSKEKFEQALSILATQIPSAGAGSLSGQESQRNRRLTNLVQVSGNPPRMGMDFAEEKALDSSGQGENDSDCDSFVGDNVASAEKAETVVNAPEVYPAWVTPASQPPCKAALTTIHGIVLHSTTSRTCITPEWLLHAACYGSNTNEPVIATAPERTNAYVQPVRAPPSTRKVRSWCRKRCLTIGNGRKRQIKAKVDANVEIAPQLEIDSNTRQVVAIDSESDKGRANLDTYAAKQNEKHLVWELSQPWKLSMTQLSQVDEVDRRETRLSQSSTLKSDAGEKAALGSHSNSNSQVSADALEGIGAQGGRIHVQGGGTLKAKIRSTLVPNNDEVDHDNAMKIFSPTPISFMSIEIHVQCRTGVSRLDSKKISMAPDSSKDKIFAIVYAYGVDPGGGESLKVLERCCLFVPFDHENTEKNVLTKSIQASMPRSNLGITSSINVECLENEKRLLLRFSSLVTTKDPDMLLSWDTQGAGLGYIIERALVLSTDNKSTAQTSDVSAPDKPVIDMVRLLGRTPFAGSSGSFVAATSKQESDPSALVGSIGNSEERKWRGSGLGSEWDERVGAGAAAASIIGRLVFAGWKIVAEEVKHPNYSYQPAVFAAVMNKRIPQHDDLLLTQWYSSGCARWRVLFHRLNQAVATLLLFDALDIIGRAGEAARLSGVEFSQSFPGIRGSQYKVEGVLLRALQSLRSDERGSKKGQRLSETPSKSGIQAYGQTGSSEIESMTQSPWKLRRGISEVPSSCEDRHYFFFSPSLDDTNRQEALEVQALTLEPDSGHYEDPVVVCDFTALYPSLVIAYNLCYSTCAGKLEYHSTRSEMRMEGRTTGRLGPFTYPERRTATVLKHHFNSLDTALETTREGVRSDRGYVAPTGTIYVAEDVLKGVLPQVLDEILTTRAMLKRAAKEYKKHVRHLSPAILRQLEARQLALKYVANVTYGYTSATFSGRCAMPLLADTIVECGRKTLRRAIDLANHWGTTKKWKGARVIYGDTDSLFVLLPGRTHNEAFDFGEELCRAVTRDNPPPVQLKLEKVYHGSIMQTMKRYCGMKYESKHQKKPTFEAKGLETVRRDQCAVTQKILKNTLITLFQDGIEAVHEYLYRQWSLIDAGHISVADFILTGGVRSQYRGGREGPVQAVLAKRIGEADPGRIIRHKERLPYVIVATPGMTFRLKDCVLTPLELLERWDAYTIHSSYYIRRHINASLQRCLGLAPHFVDVNAWYDSCPKPRRRIHFWPVRSRNRAMISTYFGSDVCSLCQRKCQASGRALVVVCPACRQDTMGSSQIALSNLNRVQTSAKLLAKECSRCNGCFEDSDTFASVLQPEDSESHKQKTMDLMRGVQNGDCLRIPLANCVCIDCPNTFLRHGLREEMIQAMATCEVLDLI